jgi:MFS family permease
MFGFTIRLARPDRFRSGQRDESVRTDNILFQETRSATALGLKQVFFITPFLVISPIAGVMVDRYNRKMMMMVSDLGAGLATLIILTLQAFGTFGILAFVWRPPSFMV